jgi:hypothetical protein
LLISIWKIDWCSGISHEDRKNHEDRKKIASRMTTRYQQPSKRLAADMNLGSEGAKKCGRHQSVKAISRKAEGRGFSIFHFPIVICHWSFAGEGCSSVNDK